MFTGPVLAFDTSAAHCAAALLSDGQIWNRSDPMDKGQAERLMPMLESLLAKAGMAWKDLARIAVGTGPGNATGVRIAVAAARGLALGLGIPAIGVTRFAATAYGLPRPLAVIEDARRGQFYLQIFDPDPQPAQLVDQHGLDQRVDGVPLVGTGVAFQPSRHALAQPIPLAEAIARIAAACPDDPVLRPAPFYLRGADATPSAERGPVILP